MNRFRFLIAALTAAGVTFALFLLMFKLISSSHDEDKTLPAITGIRFGPVDIPDEIATKDRHIPKKPPPPKNPPPAPKMNVSQTQQVVQDMPQLNLPNLDVPLTSGSGMFIGNFAQVDKTAEGDIIPIVKIAPIYPRDAALKGLEGWVKIQFTITETGTVKDPQVIAAEPRRVFDREAIRAILKWKFKPRVIDGVAVERPATQVIEFNLDRSGG